MSLGWRKATLAKMRVAWQAYATEVARGTLDKTGVEGKEAQKLRDELWMTARRVKGLGGWLGTYDTPESLLERYSAMKPFVCGRADDVSRPWRVGARMPRVVEKWLPMVSIWATTERKRQDRGWATGYWGIKP